MYIVTLKKINTYKNGDTWETSCTMGVYDSIEEVRKEFNRKTITPYKEKYFSFPTAYYKDNKENKTIEYFISVTSSISKAKVNEWEVYDWLITEKTLCDTKRR